MGGPSTAMANGQKVNRPLPASPTASAACAFVLLIPEGNKCTEKTQPIQAYLEMANKMQVQHVILQTKSSSETKLLANHHFQNKHAFWLGSETDT